MNKLNINILGICETRLANNRNFVNENTGIYMQAEREIKEE